MTSSTIGSIVGATGSYVPETILTNDDLEKLVDTSDDWIVARTGIRTRRIVAAGVAASDLALEAGRRCLSAGGLRPEKLDLIIVTTITPDYLLPATACIVQDKLGAKKAGAFDLEAACSGFVYGLAVADQFIRSGSMQNILVIGSECLSRFTDYTDRASCILFGDGAGAALLQRHENPGHEKRGFMHFKLGADGAGADMMIIPAGGSRNPATSDTVEAREHFMRIRGREVYKFAVITMQDLIQDALVSCNLNVDDVRMIIPHQVNIRILKSAAEKFGFPIERVYVNIDRYGNTSSASIPIALDEAVRQGRIRRGDVILFVAFGGGLTWASGVLRW